MAVNKPPGIATSPRHRHEGGALHNRVHHHIGRPPFVVHRLDMNTSGVLVFAKSSEAAAMLSEEFRERRPVKEYLAICQGAAWDQKVIHGPRATTRHCIALQKYLQSHTALSSRDLLSAYEWRPLVCGAF